MFQLCIYLLLQTVCSYEVTTNPSSSGEHLSDSIFDIQKNTTLVNDTKCDDNKSNSMERITQPLQTKQIERTLDSLPFSTALNSSLKENTKKTGNLENFKPSPQLETYYEYNKYPVKPALPEAKTFGNLHDIAFSSWTEKPITTSQWINKEHVPSSWSENPRGYNLKEHQKLSINPWIDRPTTTEQSSVSRVRFPQSSYTSTNERPYNFITNNEKLHNYPSTNFPATTKESFSFNKPVHTSNKNMKPSAGFWEKMMGYETYKTDKPEQVQKTFFDYNSLESPPLHIPQKEHAHEMYEGKNTWKKIIKLLTAVIPIGLLISALTPTVITVTSVNDTQSRYRAENLRHPEILNHLASSLSNLDKLNDNGCQDKVLCELLLSASTSKNSEEHIENLLNTFSEHRDIQNKKDDLIKIFDAVKKGDCSPILCGNIKNPT